MSFASPAFPSSKKMHVMAAGDCMTICISMEWKKNSNLLTHYLNSDWHIREKHQGCPGNSILGMEQGYQSEYGCTGNVRFCSYSEGC